MTEGDEGGTVSARGCERWIAGHADADFPDGIWQALGFLSRGEFLNALKVHRDGVAKFEAMKRRALARLKEGD